MIFRASLSRGITAEHGSNRFEVLGVGFWAEDCDRRGGDGVFVAHGADHGGNAGGSGAGKNLCPTRFRKCWRLATGKRGDRRRRREGLHPQWIRCKEPLPSTSPGVHRANDPERGRKVFLFFMIGKIGSPRGFGVLKLVNVSKCPISPPILWDITGVREGAERLVRAEPSTIGPTGEGFWEICLGAIKHLPGVRKHSPHGQIVGGLVCGKDFEAWGDVH